MALSVLVAAGAIVAARAIYLGRPALADTLAERFRVFHAFLWNKWYVDEVYDALVVRPIAWGSERLLWKAFDVGVIDRLVNGSARLVELAAGALRRIQTGGAQHYAYGFVVGIIVVLGVIIFR
jgi:NADH-quinone oxidoreductase subunit L